MHSLTLSSVIVLIILLQFPSEVRLNNYCDISTVHGEDSTLQIKGFYKPGNPIFLHDQLWFCFVSEFWELFLDKLNICSSLSAEGLYNYTCATPNMTCTSREDCCIQLLYAPTNSYDFLIQIQHYNATYVGKLNYRCSLVKPGESYTADFIGGDVNFCNPGLGECKLYIIY